MSLRNEARRALADWLNGANIAGLDYIHLAYPLRLDWDGYGGSGNFRCQAVIIIEDESEVRYALGGEHSGKKRIDYTVAVEVYHRSVLSDPIAAQDSLDDIVDAIKVRLRADRRLSQPEDIVWQAGEGVYGIQVDFMSPDAIGGEPLEAYARIRLEITQWITS